MKKCNSWFAIALKIEPAKRLLNAIFRFGIGIVGHVFVKGGSELFDKFRLACLLQKFLSRFVILPTLVSATGTDILQVYLAVLVEAAYQDLTKSGFDLIL
jgi:hypothetical protein